MLNVAQGPGVHLESLLFGSILTVRSSDLLLILGLGCIVLFSIVKLYRPFFCLVFDEEWAETTVLPVQKLNAVLILLAALTVAVSMRIVGVLLVGALMTIPVIAASKVRKGFFVTLLAGIALSLFSVTTGITVSYYVGWPSGGTIVIVMLGVASSIGLVRSSS